MRLRTFGECLHNRKELARRQTCEFTAFLKRQITITEGHIGSSLAGFGSMNISCHFFTSDLFTGYRLLRVVDTSIQIKAEMPKQFLMLLDKD